MIHKGRHIALLSLLLTLLVAACPKPEAKPSTNADKAALVAEIKRATAAHGNTVNLNYIDTSAITDMSYLFSIDTTNGHGLEAFNGDISKWDVSNVTNMSGMFNGADRFNQDISKWNVAKVTNMRFMFSGAYKFNQDISKWNVEKVTDMSFMFINARAFDQDISRWKVSNVTAMYAMFYSATAFDQDISGWKVSQVTTMNRMFRGAAFNQDISSWDVSKVTDMSLMFYDAKLFKQNLDAWRPKINRAVKADGWRNALFMFTDSGLASSLPSWCESEPVCKKRQ